MTSSYSPQLTLVLGGTGKTGRRVVNRLEAHGLPVRIGSRAHHPPFNWDLDTTWGPALQGVHAVYLTYQPDLAFPEAPERVDLFTRMAVERGIRRIVLLSGRNEDGAESAERAVQESGLEWTVIRSTTFAQNFSEGFMAEMLQAGEFAFPGGNVAEPFIDVEDIADIAFEALTQDRHLGQLYEVTGPRLLTFAEAVAEIATVSGREMRYVPVSPEVFAASLIEAGVPADFANALGDLFATIFDGRNASLTDGVQRALGRPARDFTDFARRAAATGVWSSSPVAA